MGKLIDDFNELILLLDSLPKVMTQQQVKILDSIEEQIKKL